MEINALETESINPNTRDLDRLSTLEMVRVINAEDMKVAQAVERTLPQIAQAVELIVSRLRAGGRLIYMGAGTSGRLGVLDASECPPTFNVPEGLVIGLIAGGDTALRHSVEAAEDRPELGRADLERIKLNERDVVVGLAASGRTPYVLGGLTYAQSVGAGTIAVACNQPAEISRAAEISILPVVGPEVVSGSTRLKAGTAQKMVLNLLSTGAMIKLGKTYGNLMVDVKPTNAKLRARAIRLVQLVAGVDETTAQESLTACEWEVKPAIVVLVKKLNPQQARDKLAASGGMLRAVLEG